MFGESLISNWKGGNFWLGIKGFVRLLEIIKVIWKILIFFGSFYFKRVFGIFRVYYEILIKLNLIWLDYVRIDYNILFFYIVLL